MANTLVPSPKKPASIAVIDGEQATARIAEQATKMAEQVAEIEALQSDRAEKKKEFELEKTRLEDEVRRRSGTIKHLTQKLEAADQGKGAADQGDETDDEEKNDLINTLKAEVKTLQTDGAAKNKLTAARIEHLERELTDSRSANREQEVSITKLNKQAREHYQEKMRGSLNKLLDSLTEDVELDAKMRDITRLAGLTQHLRPSVGDPAPAPAQTAQTPVRPRAQTRAPAHVEGLPGAPRAA